MLSRVAGAARSMGCAMERQALRAPVALAAPLRRMPTGAAPAFRNAGVKVRTMSSGGAKPAQDSPLVLFRKYLPQIALGGGALVVVYGISKIMIYVTSGLMSLDFKDVFYYGYLTGAVSVLVVAAGATYALRLARINPEGAFRRALSRVQADASAQAVLGTNIRGGNLKAYTIQPGHVSLAKRLAWVEPRVQMLFQVVGEVNEGMVTAEAVKHKGSIIFNLIALDTLAKPGTAKQVLLLKGSEDKLHVRGTLRGFLQTERAQYIPQDREEADDDAKVAEQAALPEEEDEPTKGSRR